MMRCLNYVVIEGNKIAAFGNGNPKVLSHFSRRHDCGVV